MFTRSVILKMLHGATVRGVAGIWLAGESGVNDAEWAWRLVRYDASQTVAVHDLCCGCGCC
ncbi:hypothetical protein [Planctomicrobium sp. SH527]|uniref:hypothetical protein n=1 Tax=Planctomicrobium sp. SH527 TaxID=3448123 RepID=UPI003F5BD96C